MHSNLIFRWALNFFELVACIIGIVYWAKENSTLLQKFAIALTVVFFTELIGKYLSLNVELQKYNPLLYRFWATPFQFVFFYWLYAKEFKFTKVKLVPIVIAISYITSWIFDEFYTAKTSWKWFPSLSFGIGVAGILLLVVNYFLLLMKDNKILLFFREPLFWISLGLLIGYIAIIPLYILRNGLDKNQIDLFTTYWKVGIVLNCIMYLLFTISFLCTKKK